MAQVFSISPARCCGVYEMSDISALPTPEDVVRETIRTLIETYDVCGHDSERRSFLYFVGVAKSVRRLYQHARRDDDYAGQLMDYIRANNLGSVTESPASANWSGNLLKMYVWAPDWDALRSIYRASKPSITVIEPTYLTPQTIPTTVPF